MAAMNLQPISVAVDASTWSYYKSGIFSLCGKSLDHGVLAVGYVQGQYWLIKNSWGVSWGQNGYIQLKWGNTCGLCSEPSYPNLS
jgi:C1A family cysteine protease